MRRRLALPSLGIAGAVLLLGAAPAAAGTGVSIDVGRIDVTEELAPGGEYRLPTFGVRNPGDEPTSYTMVVSYIDGQDAYEPPEAWFTFSPSEVTLAGGQSQAVNTLVEVPPDAEAGDYAALIGPQIAAAGAGAQVGAGAAARLTFTVAQCEGFECWLRWILRWIGEHLWILLIPAAVLVLLAVRVLRRRFAFSVTRRTSGA